jgi:short-subunit dehydrogenase
MPQNILITGASSGLGAALALAYASPETNLFLAGRSEPRLKAVASKVEEKGARAFIKIMDVTDAPAMDAWLSSVDAVHPLDLVIANAGISAGTADGSETAAQSAAMFATNTQGVLNTVQPVIPLMKKRGRGQIAIMSSLAGFRGIPGAPSYSASKAAVRIYGEALRGELAAFGVKVNVICPGFVRTPMTDVNTFKMPFLMEVPVAAQIMKGGLARNKARIAFPLPMTALVWLLAALPTGLIDLILARLPRKQSAVWRE